MCLGRISGGTLHLKEEGGKKENLTALKSSRKCLFVLPVQRVWRLERAMESEDGDENYAMKFSDFRHLVVSPVQTVSAFVSVDFRLISKDSVLYIH